MPYQLLEVVGQGVTNLKKIIEETQNQVAYVEPSA